MNILITGGSGFLGARLARTLLAQDGVALAGAPAKKIDTLTLVDKSPPPADLAADPRVRIAGGDLNGQIVGGEVPARNVDAVFHLAAAVSGECEADFELGMHSNFDATRLLLDACRRLGTRPLFVFASSLAVFGKLPGRPMPALIEDETLPTPQSSYGMQKYVGELLVADMTRKGFIRGRSVRLMTVSVRPGQPNGAASSFFSGMIREPLAGVRSVVPVGAQVEHPILSPSRTVEALIRSAEVSDAQWGSPLGMNFPALRCRVGDMAAALERVSPEAARLLDWQLDPSITRLVDTWPGNVASPRASALGLRADPDFESIIRAYIRENPEAVRQPVRG